MSVFKKKNAIAGIEIKHFEGIDSTKPIDSISSAYDMENFRVMSDASLEKRCGFTPIDSFSQNIRAIWSGKKNNDILTFIVHGNSVSVRCADDNSLTTIGTLRSTEGVASFLFYDDLLYLTDGVDFYKVEKDFITTTDGYAPLIGKNWESATIGPDHEPLNYMTRHIRITYVVTKSVIYLCTKYDIFRIDAVYKNGTLLDSSQYYFDKRLVTLCVLGLEVGDRIEAFLTLPYEVHDSTMLLSCRHHVVYGSNHDSRLFLWGGRANDLMFGTKEVDEASLEECKKGFPLTSPFYVPANAAFSLGREGQKITAATRQYDRLLIFTDADTWMASNPAEDGEKLDATIINSHNGCTSIGGSLLCGNDPICISKGTILRWTRDTDELDECNAHSISVKIDSRLNPSFFKNAIMFHDRRRSELLLSDPTSSDNIIWIYNLESKNWYKFSGIHADMFFEEDGRVGFVDKNNVYIFDDSVTYDTLGDGTTREIVAYFESQPLDFSISPERKKLFGLKIDANFDGGEFYVDCISNEKILSHTTVGSHQHSITGIERRISSPRFSHTKLRLTAGGDARQRLYRTGLWVKS